jgi:hypothetical protein
MANYEPPTENLPIFDVQVFRDVAPYDDFYLKRKGIATSEATETSFSGLVSFNSLDTPPHCAAVPVNPNDIANKSYVDSLAPQTSYIVYLNYSQTFTTSTPTIYKKLNPLTNNTPTTVAIHTTNTTPLLIAGFFNTKADLKFANSIPAGLWSLILYANCTANNDQNHLGLNFTLIGVTALGVESIIATSAYSPLINVLSPFIGTYACVLTIPTAIDITAYDQIGIKVYALSNTSASRDGSIFFQYPSYYSALQTSFATTQAADITITNNTWTGTNTFQNTTNLNTTIIQGAGSIQFPDTSVQTTAFKSLVSGIYTNSNITVDAQGAISAISTGVGGANAETIDLTLTASGTGYNIPYSTTTGFASTLLSGGLVYNRDTNTLAVNATNATNVIGGSAGLIPYQSGSSTTAFIPAGTVGKVLQSNGTTIPTWTTDIGGNAGSSTTIALTEDDSAGDWFIPYSKTNSATSNALYIDNTTTPLTYNANLGILSAKEYTIGGSGKVIGTNTSSIYQVVTQSVYVSWASGSQHRFYTYTALNAAVNPLNLTSLACNTTVPVNIVASASTAVSLPSLSISHITSNQTVNITPFAPATTSNPITTVDSSVISCGGGTSTRRMVLTTNSATTVGIRISSTALIIGAGGTVGPNPTHYIGFADSTGININSTICPTQTGYTLPAGTDATANVATAQWVQTAIPLATSASSNNLTGGVIGNVLYQASDGSTTRMTNGAVNTVLTSGGVGSIPTWSANLAGNAGSATLVNLTPATTGSGNFIPISTSGSGNSALLTNASLVYNHGTNTITGNVTGSAGSSGTATLASTVTLANTATGATNYLVMSETNTGTSSLITDTSGATYNSTTNTAVLNVTGNANSAVNTTITNDLVSATSHALTFVSNTTGNLPQKTRANVGTGEGLSYIPSTNALNVNIGGVGSVTTAKVVIKDNMGDISDIDNGGGVLSINNRTASSATYISTANGAGTLETRVGVSEISTVIYNKLLTEGGIIGPGTLPTYQSNMIGYTTKKNGTLANFNVVTGATIYSVHASATNGVFLVEGVWMITLYANFQPPAAAASVQFMTTGLSTDGVSPYTYVGGTGAISVCGSSSIPSSSSSRVTGGICIVMTVPSGGNTYYQLVNMTHLFATMSCLASACFFNATRLA